MPLQADSSDNRLLTIYHGLCEEELERLNAVAVQHHLESGDCLLLQHTPAHAVYVLETGVLMMERSSSTGRRQVIAFMQPGNFIGITHNEFYDFTVSALTPATVRAFPLKPFVELQDQLPNLKHNVRRIGGNILAHALDQVFALGQKKAHERVCFLLKQLSDHLPSECANQVDLVMTRQDIGDYLGLAIETVSRAFAHLKREGVIQICSAHRVEILDTEKLAELALAD